MSPLCDECEDVVVEFEQGGSSGLKEMTVSSHVLRLASPVFRAMFASGMAEAESKRIRLRCDVGTPAEFGEFYGFLLPAIGRCRTLSESNVDSLLAFSDYFQVDPLKDECEEVLMKLPASVQRLLQAHRYKLSAQYECCVQAVAIEPYRDLAPLQEEPSVFLDVATRMQQELAMLLPVRGRLQSVQRMKPKISMCKDLAWDYIKEEVLEDGRRVDEWVRDDLDELLEILR